MFTLNIGSTPCKLTQQQLKVLADRTEGFSGSDIAVVVRDALMEPVRKVQSATHFKTVRREEYEAREGKSWPPLPDGTIPEEKVTPCSPGDPDAIEKTWMEINANELLEPELVLADFVKAVQMGRKSVNESDVQKYVDWTTEFGQDG